MNALRDVYDEIQSLIEPSNRLGERLIAEKLKPIFAEVNEAFVDLQLKAMHERMLFAKG